MTRLSHIHLSHAWYRTDNQVKIGGENQKPQKWRNLQGQFGADLHLHPSNLNLCILVWLIYLRFNAFKPSRWCEKLLLRHEMGIFRTNGYIAEKWVSWGDVMRSKKNERGIFLKWVYCREMKESILHIHACVAVMQRDGSEVCDQKWGRNGCWREVRKRTEMGERDFWLDTWDYIYDYKYLNGI